MDFTAMIEEYEKRFGRFTDEQREVLKDMLARAFVGGMNCNKGNWL